MRKLQFRAKECKVDIHDSYNIFVSCEMTEEQAKAFAKEAQFLFEDSTLMLMYETLEKYLKHRRLVK